jgi:hypothetical protein
MNQYKYVIWVDGIAEYVCYTVSEAILVLDKWREQGYDDVAIETVVVIA